MTCKRIIDGKPCGGKVTYHNYGRTWRFYTCERCGPVKPEEVETRRLNDN